MPFMPASLLHAKSGSKRRFPLSKMAAAAVLDIDNWLLLPI
jgi:hypothetical protein